jgi:hypothetical protein
MIDNNLNQHLSFYKKSIDLYPAYEMIRQIKLSKKAPKEYLSDKWLE